MNAPARLTGAKALTEALGGRWRGRSGACRCPAHDDRTPSMSISTGNAGTVLWHCHAGCDNADVTDALLAKGLIGGNGCRSRSFVEPVVPVGPDEDDARRTRKALEDWGRTTELRGTRADIYLASRNIRLRPDDLKYDARDGAMVAAIRRRGGSISAIQKTYLTPDGRKDPARGKRQKLSFGPVKHGAIRLTPVAKTVWLTEGAEDALSLIQMTGRACWAIPGAGIMKAVELPEAVKTIVIAADNDDAGRKAAAEAQAAFIGQGRCAFICRPPAGRDWNDLLAEFEERVGIAQFDGGEDPAAAMAATLKTWRLGT